MSGRKIDQNRITIPNYSEVRFVESREGKKLPIGDFKCMIPAQGHQLIQFFTAALVHFTTAFMTFIHKSAQNLSRIN